MPWRSPNRPRSDRRPGPKSPGLTTRGNLATLWRQLQRRLTSLCRPNLTVRDASASHLFEVRITAGLHAGHGCRRREGALPGLRMARRVPGDQRVCRNQDPHQEVDQ